MAPTRRDVLRLGAAVALAATCPAGAAGTSNDVAQAIAAFTKGARPLQGGVQIEVPEIADNGGAVPVRVVAEGARRIALFADGNPRPGVAVFRFGRLAPPAASTRVRLAESQTLIAVAETTEGTFRMASRRVVVVVGGCA